MRETSRAAIRRFRAMGLNVVMLTGDNRKTAEAIRKELDIGEAIADVLPTQKEAVIRRLQEQGHKVAMVGDGINDAPALTRADIGIAIGAGTDIAIDSADVVLMKDSLEDAATAIDLSRATIRNIHMNLFWAFFYNVLGIPVAAGALFPAFGIRLSPMIGSAAMSLSSVCVVTNALRLRFFKRRESGAVDPSAPAMEAGQHTPGDLPAEETKKGMETMEKVLHVEGMMCAHCKAHVEKALLGVNGVTAAEADVRTSAPWSSAAAKSPTKPSSAPSRKPATRRRWRKTPPCKNTDRRTLYPAVCCVEVFLYKFRYSRMEAASFTGSASGCV